MLSSSKRSAYKDHFIDEIIQGIWIVQIIMSITNRLNKAFRTVQSITHKLFYGFMRLRISQTKQMDFFYAFGPLMKLDRHGHKKKKNPIYILVLDDYSKFRCLVVHMVYHKV